MLSVIHTLNSLHPDSGGPARTVTSLCECLSKIENTNVTLVSQRVGHEEMYLGNMSSDLLSVASAGDVLSHKLGLSFRHLVESEMAAGRSELVHDHGLWLPTNFHAASLAKKFSLPYVLHTRGMLEPWAMSFGRNKKQMAWWLYQKKILDSVALFFATSMAEAKHIRSLGFSQPISIIPNGVQAPTVNLDFRLRLPDDRQRTVVFMSRIHPKKGLLELLHAWKDAAPEKWNLLLAGPDESEHLKQVQSLIVSLGISDSVDYLGVVEDDAKAELLTHADVFILPSFSENFGVVVAEALSFGIPVIASKGTPWQSLVENKCGWWVESERQALTAALKEAINLSDEERFQMGSRGQSVARNFDWRKIADETKDVYNWLLGRAGCPESVWFS